MTAGELAVLLAAVLCSIGFAALVVVLVRVLDTLRELRREVSDLRAETRPLLHDLRISTIEARETVDEARSDLERFDRVLGSAEAIGDAVSVHVARTAFSAPMIKFAGLAKGTSRTFARLRGTPANRAVGPKDGPSRTIDIGTDEPIELEDAEPTEEAPSMMKRITWFVGGAAAGVVGANYATKKVKQTAAQISPSAGGAIVDVPVPVTSPVTSSMPSVKDARSLATTKTSSAAKREGRLESLADHVDPGDQVFVDGVPVESGRVIVMRKKEHRRPV